MRGGNGVSYQVGGVYLRPCVYGPFTYNNVAVAMSLAITIIVQWQCGIFKRGVPGALSVCLSVYIYIYVTYVLIDARASPPSAAHFSS